MGPARAVRLPESGRSLQRQAGELPVVLANAAITVELTDRESSRLVVAAYRLAREKGVPPALAEALVQASKFIETMACLPTSSDLLHKWLDDSMADDVQRRRFDWIALRNGVNAAITEIEVDVRAKINEWLDHATAVLRAQQDGTPLARAMVNCIKNVASTESQVLVPGVNYPERSPKPNARGTA